MNNTRLHRVFASTSLALLASILVLSNFNTFAGPRKSDPPNLVNSVWKGPIVNFDTAAGPATVQAFFLFEKEGKVTECAIAIKLSQIRSAPNRENPYYNPAPWAYRDGTDPYASSSPFRDNLITTPGITRTVQVVGKYRFEGTDLYVEFSGYSISATINGDEMAGVLTNDKSGEKEAWRVQKLSLPRQG